MWVSALLVSMTKPLMECLLKVAYRNSLNTLVLLAVLEEANQRFISAQRSFDNVIFEEFTTFVCVVLSSLDKIIALISRSFLIDSFLEFLVIASLISLRLNSMRKLLRHME